MEGWNDCPLPMLSTNGPSRARKRASRVVAPSISSQGNSPLSSVAGLPPPSTPSAMPQTKENDNQMSAEENLREIVAQRGLAGKEGEVLANKLIETLGSLDEQLQTVINLILASAIAQSSVAALKGQVVKYMMMNSGSSLWCLHLQRLIELAYEDTA